MSALLAAVLIAVVVVAAAGLVARLAARGSLALCLAGQIGALTLRMCGLLAIALLLHLRWPGDLLLGLAGAAVVLLAGLALDARHLLRTVRAPSEERVRA